MIISVHQPQYIPWLGYFYKIATSEVFIFLDDVQYKKREFQNRNKIKTSEGSPWLTVPVLTKGSFEQTIREVRINREESWAKEHWKTIEHNYNRAPFFNEHRDFFTGLYSKKWDLLIDLSMEVIRYVNSYLKIETPVMMSSEFNLSSKSSERIIDICKRTGADVYLSGSGGKQYIDEKVFADNSIKLVYQDFSHPVYPQLHGAFVSHLSVLDLLFNCGPKSRDILLSI
jgi:hypothetical protein